MNQFLKKHIILIAILLFFLPSFLKIYFNNHLVIAILMIVIVCFIFAKFPSALNVLFNKDRASASNFTGDEYKDDDYLDDFERELEKSRRQYEKKYIAKGGKLIFINPNTGEIAYFNSTELRNMKSQGQEWIPAEQQYYDEKGQFHELLTDDEIAEIKRLEKKEKYILNRIGRNVDFDVRQKYIFEQMGGEDVYNWLNSRRLFCDLQEMAMKEAAYYYVERLTNYASKRIPEISGQDEFISKNTSSEQRRLYGIRKKELEDRKREQERRRNQEKYDKTIIEQRRLGKLIEEEAEQARREAETDRMLAEEAHRRRVEQSLSDIEWELRYRS